mgnify:FL=1
MLKIKKIENKNEVSVEAQNIGCWFDCNKKNKPIWYKSTRA